MIMMEHEPNGQKRFWDGRGLSNFVRSHRLSTTDLALRTGLRPSTVSGIMASRIEPSISTAALIYRECRLVDPTISFSDLFFDAPEVRRDL
jgi:transcriptional regulator with XRE-family HTH domain